VKPELDAEASKFLAALPHEANRTVTVHPFLNGEAGFTWRRDELCSLEAKFYSSSHDTHPGKLAWRIKQNGAILSPPTVKRWDEPEDVIKLCATVRRVLG
jgi:hypothetical protein